MHVKGKEVTEFLGGLDTSFQSTIDAYPLFNSLLKELNVRTQHIPRNVQITDRNNNCGCLGERRIYGGDG